jgi:hypothetical protein
VRRAVPLLLIGLLALVRHDLWWWDDPSRVLGLPIGLAYHVLYCVAVAGVMAWIVRANGVGEDGAGDAR